jgi:CRP-like cAMP-binding protein
MLATKAEEQTLLRIFRGGTKLTYKKGEFIIRPGEAPSGVFFIQSGLVKAYDISKYGEENLLIIRKSQEIFPLIWAVTGQERDIIYEALGPVEVWRVSRENFLKHMQENSKSVLTMLDMTIEMYRLHSEHILNLEYRTVRERLISFLLNTADRFGNPPTKSGRILIDVPLKQQDIASSINATRETTSRELAYLERQKLIVRDRQSRFIIPDVEKLRGYLE